MPGQPRLWPRLGGHLGSRSTPASGSRRRRSLLGVPCTLLPPMPLQAARLTLVQILINARGLAMNPLQSLYYVSPACLLCLAVPFGGCPAS